MRHLKIVLGAGAVGSLSDGELLDRFLAGRGDAASSAAFAALVERHGPMVLRVCRGVLRDPHDAEDASQATFLVLARKGGSVRRSDSLASWLFGVALRVAAKARDDSARRRARERRGAEMRPRPGDGEGRWSDLHEEVGRLPEKYRTPVVLCHIEGLTHEQAANALGLPLRTVQRRLTQGRDRLRVNLERRGLAPAVGLPGSAVVVDPAPLAWVEATVRAASGIATASATVASLTEGVLTMMFLVRLKAIAAGVLVIGAASAALVAVGSSDEPKPTPAAKGEPGKAAAIPASLGPRVEGVVVDEAGRPVAGARVSSLWTVDPKPVTSAADGTFALDTGDPRRANLCFLGSADGGARQGIFRFADMSGAKDPRTPVRIVLKPARAVTVTVVDGKGMPVPGAEVFVLDLVFPVAEGKTDGRGVVALRAPVDAMTQWVFGYRRGVGFDYFENYRTIPPIPFAPPPARARLVLDGARTARVRVVDSSGKPAPGVGLTPWTIRKKGKLNDVNLSGFLIKAASDAAGVATFDWLPADLQGRTTFLLGPGSHTLAKSPEYDPARPDLDLVARVLKPAPVSGKVTRPDGSPAAGILVEASGAGPGTFGGAGRARAGLDGTYAMGLAPDQSYMIAVVDDDWAAPSHAGMIVLEGQPRTDFDFRLSKGGVIRGRVTAGPAASPEVGQTVILFEDGPIVPAGTFPGQGEPLNPTFLRTAETDGDGRYAFRVAPGSYRLSGPRPPGSDRSPESIAVGEGEETIRDFHLIRPTRSGRTLRGIVRSKAHDGPPIAGAVLIEETIGLRVPPVQGFADDAGRFELPPPGASALIYARDPEGNLAGYATVGEDAKDVAIVAGPAATARGRVVDSAGKPRAGVRVSYWVAISPEEAEPPVGAGQSTLTDGDGRFNAPGLLPGGRCRLFASNVEGGNSPDLRFEVKDARPIDVGDIVLDPRAP